MAARILLDCLFIKNSLHFHRAICHINLGSLTILTMLFFINRLLLAFFISSDLPNRIDKSNCHWFI